MSSLPCEPPCIEQNDSSLARECDRMRLQRTAALAEVHTPIYKLPDDLLIIIFEKFHSSWGPWVPWAPVGWTPPPPLTPKQLTCPQGVHETTERMEREDFNTLRQNLCLVSR